VDLLLTDLVMPEGLNGRDLADRLRHEKPGLKVIYSSGYSEDVLAGSAAAPGANYLAKPYDPSRLVKTVRECLDATN
jgi:CheY-like chemotaxis protein